MNQFQHQGVTSPTYPEGESQIRLTATDFGVMEESFNSAITCHGNDRTAVWPCFTDHEEGFSVSYEGKGTTPLEGSYWSIWSVSFAKQEKTLRIDVGQNSVERFDSGTYVSASFRDISDLIAACSNLIEYDHRQKLQGLMALHTLPVDLGILLEKLEENPNTE